MQPLVLNAEGSEVTASGMFGHVLLYLDDLPPMRWRFDSTVRLQLVWGAGKDAQQLKSEPASSGVESRSVGELRGWSDETADTSGPTQQGPCAELSVKSSSSPSHTPDSDSAVTRGPDNLAPPNPQSQEFQPNHSSNPDSLSKQNHSSNPDSLSKESDPVIALKLSSDDPSVTSTAAGLTSPSTAAGLTSPSTAAGLTSPSTAAGLTSPSTAVGLTSPSTAAGLTSDCASPVTNFCQFCRKRFSSFKNWDAHLRSRACSVKCENCGERFPSQGDLFIHHFYVYGLNFVSTEYPQFDFPKGSDSTCDLEREECPVCEEVFPNLAQFKDHIHGVHFEEKTFKCCVCGTVTTSKTKLNQHMQGSHPASQFEAETEGFNDLIGLEKNQTHPASPAETDGFDDLISLDEDQTDADGDSRLDVRSKKNAADLKDLVDRSENSADERFEHIGDDGDENPSSGGSFLDSALKKNGGGRIPGRWAATQSTPQAKRSQQTVSVKTKESKLSSAQPTPADIIDLVDDSEDSDELFEDIDGEGEHAATGSSSLGSTPKKNEGGKMSGRSTSGVKRSNHAVSVSSKRSKLSSAPSASTGAKRKTMHRKESFEKSKLDKGLSTAPSPGSGDPKLPVPTKAPNKRSPRLKTCKICSKDYVKLTDHFRPPNLSTSCPTCRRKVLSRAHLIVHQLTCPLPTARVSGSPADLEEGFGSRAYLLCPLCGDRRRRSSLVEHIMRYHTKESVWSCCVCREGFSHRKVLQDHLQTHQGQESQRGKWHCTLCPAVFPSSGELRSHSYTHRTVCVFCGKDFFTTAPLRQHYHSEHADQLLQCRICDHRVATKHQLWTHERYHRYNHKRPCQICGKMIRSNNSLEQHVARCHKSLAGDAETKPEAVKSAETVTAGGSSAEVAGEGPAALGGNSGKCEAGAAVSSIDGNAAGGVTTSEGNSGQSDVTTGEGNAGQSGVTTSEGNAGQSGVTTSEGNAGQSGGQASSEATCSICSASFPTKGWLQRHMFRKHNQSEGLKFPCPYCPLAFGTRSGLGAHVSRHTKKREGKVHVCSVCGKCCLLRSNLRIHMRVHAPEKCFFCHVCGQGFNYKASLQGHLRSKHGLEK